MRAPRERMRQQDGAPETGVVHSQMSRRREPVQIEVGARDERHSAVEETERRVHRPTADAGDLRMLAHQLDEGAEPTRIRGAIAVDESDQVGGGHPYAVIFKLLLAHGRRGDYSERR